MTEATAHEIAMALEGIHNCLSVITVTIFAIAVDVIFFK